VARHQLCLPGDSPGRTSGIEPHYPQSIAALGESALAKEMAAIRDKGTWFAGTAYSYLHICGTLWGGTEYHEGDKAVSTMSYAPR
jgi:hypothetical protein